MWKIEKEHLRNEHIRNRLQVPDVHEIITKRQLQFIGKIARMPDSRLPRRLLTAWVGNPRKKGKPHLMVRNSYVDALHQLLGEEEVGQKAILTDWIDKAECESSWLCLLNNWETETNRRQTRLGVHGSRHRTRDNTHVSSP